MVCTCEVLAESVEVSPASPVFSAGPLSLMDDVSRDWFKAPMVASRATFSFDKSLYAWTTSENNHDSQTSFHVSIKNYKFIAYHNNMLILWGIY